MRNYNDVKVYTSRLSPKIDSELSFEYFTHWREFHHSHFCHLGSFNFIFTQCCLRIRYGLMIFFPCPHVTFTVDLMLTVKLMMLTLLSVSACELQTKSLWGFQQCSCEFMLLCGLVWFAYHWSLCWCEVCASKSLNY